jgi:predicted nucleotide-binding protein (sugar kinase/HSP70/actin superfamily)
VTAREFPTAEIIRDYLYITSSSCGPCRFGSYVTEYRKALRDAGFEGFRVLTASQTGGVRQAAGSGDGLVGTPKLYLSGLFGLVVGDILNALMYRIRPYEVNAGDTDRVIEECRCLIESALGAGKSLLWPLWQCRKKLTAIAVDRSRVKPKVSVIGEFWAMTTEGDGNYRLPAFLEAEGAEVDVQLLTAWMLYLIWSARHDTKQRATLKMSDAGPHGLLGKSPTRKLATLWVAEKALLAIFGFFARLLGLRDYHFPSMDEIAEVSREFYNSNNRGGEGHMEVGKFILNARHQKMNLTLSVKPFGCMPSSAVSDGIQSKVTALYPHALFLPVETTGDGAVNVYSRIQMQLHRARQQAKEEVAAALKEKGQTEEAFRAALLASKANHALYYPQQTVACTAANILHSLG